MFRGSIPSLLISALSLVMTPLARAQHDHSSHGNGASPTPPRASSGSAADATSESMGRSMVESPHMKMTAIRPANAADSARARAVLAELRDGIEKYQDYRVALDDGYRIFLPNVPLKVYHFTNYGRAFWEHRRFDPAKPSSLLYEKTADGGYELVGAMYVAGKRTSLAELDKRIPLSIAQWHAHVNICVPSRRQVERWRETSDGKPKFGPAGTITTRKECDRERARFFPQLFGWMVHVNALAEDPKEIWGAH